MQHFPTGVSPGGPCQIVYDHLGVMPDLIRHLLAVRNALEMDAGSRCACPE